MILTPEINRSLKLVVRHVYKEIPGSDRFQTAYMIWVLLNLGLNKEVEIKTRAKGENKRQNFVTRIYFVTRSCLSRQSFMKEIPMLSQLIQNCW